MALLLWVCVAPPSQADEGRAQQKLRLPAVFLDGKSGPTQRYAQLAVDENHMFNVAGPPELPMVARVALGSQREPVKVVHDPGDGRPLRVLLRASNVKLIAPIAAERFVEMTAGPTTVVAAPTFDGQLPADRTPGARLGPGLAVVRVAGPSARQQVPIKYTDEEVEVTGYVDAHALGRSYFPGRLFARPPHPTGQLREPTEIQSTPGGPRLAYLPNGGRVKLLGLKRGEYQLIRWWGSIGQAMVTGWVAQGAVTLSAKLGYGRCLDCKMFGRSWVSIPGLPGYGLTRVFLKNGALLQDRPGGEIVGVVTEDHDFLLLERKGQWLSVGVGHPMGFMRTWVIDDPAQPLAISVESPPPSDAPAGESSDLTDAEHNALREEITGPIPPP